MLLFSKTRLKKEASFMNYKTWLIKDLYQSYKMTQPIKVL